MFLKDDIHLVKFFHLLGKQLFGSTATRTFHSTNTFVFAKILKYDFLSLLQTIFHSRGLMQIAICLLFKVAINAVSFSFNQKVNFNLVHL